MNSTNSPRSFRGARFLRHRGLDEAPPATRRHSFRPSSCAPHPANNCLLPWASVVDERYWLLLLRGSFYLPDRETARINRPLLCPRPSAAQFCRRARGPVRAIGHGSRTLTSRRLSDRKAVTNSGRARVSSKCCWKAHTGKAQQRISKRRAKALPAWVDGYRISGGRLLPGPEEFLNLFWHEHKAKTGSATALIIRADVRVICR